MGRANNEFATVLVRCGKMLLVLVLVTVLGGHWALLQTLAWTTMLADNLQSASLPEAVAKTFDGKHPCCLCKAIAAGKNAEQKKEFTAPLQKLEFPPARENVAAIAPSQFQWIPLAHVFADSSAQPPPTPPPRSFFV